MMKALVIQKPGEIRMIETPKPVPGEHEVLVRVAYAGICGTDLEIYSGELCLAKQGAIRYPIRLGHEWSGVVEAAGTAVQGFIPGDRVVSDTAVSCGECEDCVSGHYERCRHTRSIGTVNCYDGCFAEYMLLPERHLYHLPENIALDEAALIEPATVALAGLRRMGDGTGKTLLVTGTGAIGLIAVALAKSMGYKKVYISGRKPFKLDIGRALGADATVDVSREDLLPFIQKETGGKGVDAAMETSGNIATVNEVAASTARHGVIALVGFYGENLHGFDANRIVSEGIELKGILNEFEMVARIIDLMQNGKLCIKPLITHRVRLAEAAHAMETARENNGQKIKTLIDMRL